MAEKKQQKDHKTPAKAEITLKKKHTHAGKKYEKGDKIEVTERQAKWLKGLGVAA